MYKKVKFFSLVAILSGIQVCAQQTTKPVLPTAADRFGFGKSIYVANEHGSNIPYDAISSDIQGWGRFVMVPSADKADLIAEVTSYEGGGVSNTSKTDYGTDGKPKESYGTSRNLSASSIILKVYEGKSKRVLWSGTENAKSGFKKKTEEDNLVAAAEKLFLRFHDFVEPPAK